MRHEILRRWALIIALAPTPIHSQEGKELDPARPQAVRTEGVPPVPARIASGLARYRQVEWASFSDWSPSGGIIFSSRIGNLSQLYHAGAPGASPKQLTSADEPVTGGRAIPDGSVIFSRGSGGDENFQLFRLRPGGAEPERLTDGRSRNLLGAIDKAGRRLAFTTTARNGRDADVFMVNLEKNGPPELLFQVENETWSLDEWSDDLSKALVTRFVSANETLAFVLDLHSKSRTPVPPETPDSGGKKVRRDNLRFAPGARAIYLTTDARGEFRELARLDLEKGAYTWLTEDLPFDVEDVELSRDGRLAVLAVNAEGYSRLFALDVEAVNAGKAVKDARRELSVPRGVAGGLRLDPTGTRLGLTWGSASSPSEAYSLEVATGRWERWTKSRDGGFATGDFVEPELVRYRSFDGREVPAFLHRPKGSGRAPVVINIHGGPEGQSRPVFSARTQYWVRELGAAVAFPNVRGSTGYGKSYSKLDDGLLRLDSVRDIGALLDWIAADERLDPARVAVYGGSYGGFMVLASLVQFRDRIKAGVDAVGISNFRTFLENTSPYRRDLRRVEYGDERDPKFRELFERISPAGRIHEIRSALFVVHGDNDPRVPISEAKQIVEKAKSSGKPVWTLYAANEGHGFQRRENSDYLDAATALFFEQNLLASPDGPLHHERAVLLFRSGKFAESAAEFDRAVELGGRTHSSDACWERGLARYYAGDFDGGRRQFEGYHKVGPLDIENGLWIYICEAAKRPEGGSLDKARAAIPAYTDRKRPPFPALLDLYLGKGTVEAVFAQAEASGGTRDDRSEAMFYAHLYTGKYLQTMGKTAEALEHMKKALELPLDHFMYWCAQAEVKR